MGAQIHAEIEAALVAEMVADAHFLEHTADIFRQTATLVEIQAHSDVDRDAAEPELLLDKGPDAKG